VAERAGAGVRGAAYFPALFVLLWSTGFIAAKFGLPYASPFAFLFYRFLLVAALMAIVALLAGARWPDSLADVGHVVVAALLVHGLYLGGVFVALAGGMAAGTSAMLVGFQPILTVVLAWLWLHERVSARQWAGLALGLAGVFCVVGQKMSLAGGYSGLLACTVALAGISVGTLYQKRHCAHIDLISGSVVQFAACALVYAPFAWPLETAAVQWTRSFVFALAWSVVVLSVGAISLLYWLLRHGATAGVARLFYLVPPVTALEAWLLFGETPGVPAIAGMAFIAVGVALARPHT
jgi:drug/metabolite transporter (DMT)-like permease